MSLPGRVLLTSIKSPRFIAQLTEILSRIHLKINDLLAGVVDWDEAFSWGDHASAGYAVLDGNASGQALKLGTATSDIGLPYNEVISAKVSTSGPTGRAALALQNTDSSSGSLFALANQDNSKRVIFALTNSSYPIPDLASIGTNGGTPFYFITDGEVASGGTSNVYFRLGGYSTAADAFTFDYRIRLGVGVTNPNYDISFNGNASKTIASERHITSNTAGNNLQIIAGGATSGATNKNGGSLLLRSGIATGTGESGVKIQTAVAGASGTSDRFSTNVMVEALGNKLAFNGSTPIAKPTVTGSRGGNAALASLLTALANLGLITDSTTA